MVMLGVPAHRDFPAATVVSLLDTAQLCERSGIELLLCVISDCSLGAFAARNLVAHEFLKSDCSHLFFVDSDMSWAAGDFLRVVELDEPFVAVPGPSKRETPRLLVTEDGVGLCFCCIKREVIEKIAATKPLAKCHGRKEPVRQIFQCTMFDGKLVGEDYQFCKDVTAAGYTINIIADIALGHIGMKEYRYENRHQ